MCIPHSFSISVSQHTAVALGLSLVLWLQSCFIIYRVIELVLVGAPALLLHKCFPPGNTLKAKVGWVRVAFAHASICVRFFVLFSFCLFVLGFFGSTVV